MKDKVSKTPEEMLAGSGRIYSCIACNDFKGLKYAVEDHVLREHVFREDAPYRCLEHKTFYKNRRLAEKHLRKHPGEKFDRVLGGTYRDLNIEQKHALRLDRESSLKYYELKLGQTGRDRSPTPECLVVQGSGVESPEKELA